jgi:4-amino-4-deoxy-L-arabinose transferase-like glycosyltransferase
MSSSEWSTRPGLSWTRGGALAPAASEIAGLLEPLLLCGLALAVRLAWLHADLHIDELYHLLAARGWSESGIPRIGEGVYDRAFLFTALIGWWQEIFGAGVLVARLPSVVAGTALVLAVFLWTRRVAGPLAAWIAGLLLAFSPIAVELSQLTRFYALHALLFWLVAVCTWHALAPGTALGSRLAAIALGLLSALLAAHLQLLTLIGFAGLGLWLAGLLVAPVWMWLRAQGAIGLVIASAVLTAAILALALAAAAGLADPIWHQYRWTPLWAQQFQNQVHFYHVRLAEQYPVLWPLTGFAAFAALSFRPRAAAFCATVFGVAFLSASFAGMKDDRYLVFALPFLFALWGMALAAVAAPLTHALLALIERARGLAAPWLPAGPTGAVALAAAALFALSAGGASSRLAFDLARGKLPEGPGRITPDWAAARTALAPWLEDADAVITSDEMAALFHLDRSDALISGTRLSEIGDGREFGRDPRTGIAVISSPASLRALIACREDGLVILSERDLAFDWAVRPETVAALATAATPMPVPGLDELRVFRWRTPAAALRPCPAPVGAAPHG